MNLLCTELLYVCLIPRLRSDLIFTPTVLHPRYKSMYFRKVKWPQAWIETAEQLLRDQYDQYYKVHDKSVSKVILPDHSYLYI